MTRARVKEEVKEQLTSMDAKFIQRYFIARELCCRYHSRVTVTQKPVLREGGGSPGPILAATKGPLSR